jgi:hypothetical protein
VRTGVGIKGFAGIMDGQSVQIVAEDFGVGVLLGRQPGHSGQMFKEQMMLDPFEPETHIEPKTLPRCQGKTYFPRCPLVPQPLLLLAAHAAMPTAFCVESIGSVRGSARIAHMVKTRAND